MKNKNYLTLTVLVAITALGMACGSDQTGEQGALLEHSSAPVSPQPMVPDPDVDEVGVPIVFDKDPTANAPDPDEVSTPPNESEPALGDDGDHSSDDPTSGEDANDPTDDFSSRPQADLSPDLWLYPHVIGQLVISSQQQGGEGPADTASEPAEDSEETEATGGDAGTTIEIEVMNCLNKRAYTDGRHSVPLIVVLYNERQFSTEDGHTYAAYAMIDGLPAEHDNGAVANDNEQESMKVLATRDYCPGDTISAVLDDGRIVSGIGPGEYPDGELIRLGIYRNTIKNLSFENEHTKWDTAVPYADLQNKLKYRKEIPFVIRAYDDNNGDHNYTGRYLDIFYSIKDLARANFSDVAKSIRVIKTQNFDHDGWTFKLYVNTSWDDTVNVLGGVLLPRILVERLGTDGVWTSPLPKNDQLSSVKIWNPRTGHRIDPDTNI